MQSKLQSLPQLEAPSSFAEIQRAMARPAAAPRRLVSPRLVAALAFVTLTAIFFVALRDETAPKVVRGAQPSDSSRNNRPTPSSTRACRS